MIARSLNHQISRAGEKNEGAINGMESISFLVIDDQNTARQTLRSCIHGMGGVLVEFASGYSETIVKINDMDKLPDVIFCGYPDYRVDGA